MLDLTTFVITRLPPRRHASSAESRPWLRNRRQGKQNCAGQVREGGEGELLEAVLGLVATGAQTRKELR